MRTIETDVAIIGAGTAGLNARRAAVKAGKRWLLIQDGPFGTTCARVGCMPSKLLIAAADVAHEAKHGGMFGVHSEVRVDGREVMDRVKRERDRFAGFVVQANLELPQDQVLLGRARFVGPTTVEVGDHTRVQARAVVIGTGSSPWIPPQLSAIADDVMVNDDVFELDDLPGSIAVVGTGIIGLELGQAMHRLGVRTAFFNPFEELGPFTDPEVKAKARAVFGAELELHLGGAITSADKIDGGYLLRWRDADGAEGEAAFDKVLAAAGRRPNLAGLGLESTGMALDASGRPAAWSPTTTQCGDLPIFMAGDVSGYRPLLHEAADEGQIAGANAASWPQVSERPRRTSLAVAFTEPQMAIVGTRYADLRHDRVVVGQVSYDDQGRSRVMGKNAGLVRIYASTEDHTLVGAEMLGPRVEHTSHLLAWAVQQQLTPLEALSMPFYHPVVEEGIRTALRDLAAKLKIAPRRPPTDCADSAAT
ncbi:MAG: dihydrolipoyl dehydrogenase [Proteobacteria bacterium]|nr:MAG: dihydrolipoyl dehydrogenase [Pseudomonadota bacterium]